MHSRRISDLVIEHWSMQRASERLLFIPNTLGGLLHVMVGSCICISISIPASISAFHTVGGPGALEHCIFGHIDGVVSG
jgi:hypothetical protein